MRVVTSQPIRSQRARSLRGTAARLLVATAVTLGAGVLVTAPAEAAVVRPFSSSSPFNVAVKSNPAIDGNSAAMISRATRTGMVHANLFEYGIPIHTATASTPKVNVDCTTPSSWGWGACPLEAKAMPIPAAAVANQGSDGVLTVIDSTNNTIGEYWQASKVNSSNWATSWGAINSLTGSGWGGSSTGSGASRIAGVVRVAEIQAGWIDHALVMQSDNICKGVFRAPALKTDGDSTRGDCIPEGARLQLDPSINIDAISGITAGEKTVARALQTYGAYMIDRANTSLGISFEMAPDGSWSTPGSAYKAAGFAWDYYGMPKIPWNKMRVLKTWN